MAVKGLTDTDRRIVTHVFGPPITPDAALNGPPARKCLRVGAARIQIAKGLKDQGQYKATEIRKWQADLALDQYEAERLREARSMDQSRKKTLRAM